MYRVQQHAAIGRLFGCHCVRAVHFELRFCLFDMEQVELACDTSLHRIVSTVNISIVKPLSLGGKLVAAASVAAAGMTRTLRASFFPSLLRGWATGTGD